MKLGLVIGWKPSLDLLLGFLFSGKWRCDIAGVMD